MRASGSVLYANTVATVGEWDRVCSPEACPGDNVGGGIGTCVYFVDVVSK